MPHKLSELNAMSEQQLRALGEKLNIKGAAKMDLPTLGFAILDTEAEIESKKPVEPKPAAKKRGRPKKDAQKAEPVKADPKPEAKPEPKPEAKPAAAKPEVKPADDSAAPAPKKRGRKPKAAAAAEGESAPPQAAAPAAEAPKTLRRTKPIRMRSLRLRSPAKRVRKESARISLP